MASLSCPADDELLRGADTLLVPLFDDDELLRGADALLGPLFDKEFALGPPILLVRPDRVWLVGDGIRAPDVEVLADGGTGSAEEPDVLRVCGMHAFLTPPSTPFSANLIHPKRERVIRRVRCHCISTACVRVKIGIVERKEANFATRATVSACQTLWILTDSSFYYWNHPLKRCKNAADAIRAHQYHRI